MEQSKPKEPQKELEILVSELEERVDRLRALYEQYFMGYEKLEPTIVRKDVDRRFVFLRKQQIRNTALRFKFNVITQKFQTYSMYWTRICRQIEDGTYKRHVLKAAKRFAEAEAKTSRSAHEKEQSIDVDLADFDETELEALLRQADAESAAFDRAGLGADTIPPGMPSMPPPELRGAIVPVSQKPRVVLKKREEAPAAPTVASAAARPGEAARPGPAIRPIPGAPGAIARPVTPANAMRPGPAIRPVGQGPPPGQPAKPASPGAGAAPAAPPARPAPATPAAQAGPARPGAPAPIARPAPAPATASAPGPRPAGAPAPLPAARPALTVTRPPTPAAAGPAAARPAPAPTRVPTPQAPITPQTPGAGAPAPNRPVTSPERVPLPSTARATPGAPFVPTGTPRPAPAGPAGTPPLRTPATPGGELQRPLIRRTAPTPDRGDKKGP